LADLFQGFGKMARHPASIGGFKNLLLRRLSSSAVENLEPHLHPIQLEVRQAIYEPHQTVQYAYFLESGMISMVSLMEDGRSIEVGTVGKEGIAGGFLILGRDVTFCQFFVQIAGYGHRIGAEALREMAARSSELKQIILRYEDLFLAQTLQAVACNGLHTVQQRCCRWLLMARDRAESDELLLTHEFLALMLGVRRASITEVLQPLQEAGLVRSVRGEITILDRPQLEAAACECYRIMTKRQNRAD
jgi:CRP-like cAMP-binding protein